MFIVFDLDEFQFPSNGKVYLKSRATRRPRLHQLRTWFQFPSNGKVYLKQTCWETRRLPSPTLFQFPSNGKVYLKLRINEARGLVLCFNSLQTGKCISSNNLAKRLKERILQFQFPSNGKVYLKQGDARTPEDQRRVSIPFKRESVSQDFIHELKEDSIFIRVSIPFKRESVSQVDTRRAEGRHKAGFNSLQTGKCISSPKWSHPNPCAQNSLFQFPSNGKVYLKDSQRVSARIQVRVSIPFKRESVSQASTLRIYSRAFCRFQFPSNGKVYLKPSALAIASTTAKLVSIPFKRESVSQAVPPTVQERCAGFQFPSNGKVYLKQWSVI